MKKVNTIQLIKKTIASLSIALLLTACSNNQMSIQIPAQQQVVIDYPNYDVFAAELSNRSLSSVAVSVQSKDKQKKIRSFGLDALGNATVMVERENQLLINNNSTKDITLKIAIEERDRVVFEKKGEYRTFTLHNTTGKNIQLTIPTVMNPNLSPFSKSGVDLKMGQEILFRVNGKKQVLLTVDESIKNGDVINVSKLIQRRKKELGV